MKEPKYKIGDIVVALGECVDKDKWAYYQGVIEHAEYDPSRYIEWRYEIENKWEKECDIKLKL